MFVYVAMTASYIPIMRVVSVSVRKHVEGIESVVILWRRIRVVGVPMWTTEKRTLSDRSQLRYPSDLTDEEWALIEPMIVNGVMYVLSTGCQWRALPKDMPPRSTMHGYFDSDESQKEAFGSLRSSLSGSTVCTDVLVQKPISGITWRVP